MFLQLLVAQMRYQDPMNPTDSSEFLAQTAQFTALEKMQTVADQTSQLVGPPGRLRCEQHGRPDGVLRRARTARMLAGVVDSVRFEATGPVLQVDGEDVPFADVQSVGDGSHRPHRAPDDDDAADAPVDRRLTCLTSRSVPTLHVPEGNHHASFTLRRHQRASRQPDHARRHRQQHRQRQHDRLQVQQRRSSRTP